MNVKRKTILDRIGLLEEAIHKAREYLQSGKHANWSGFRPWFYGNVRDGRPGQKCVSPTERESANQSGETSRPTQLR
jgi:hypothetical protein